MRKIDTLHERVGRALHDNPHLLGKRVELQTAHGRVTLSGAVSTFFQKQMAQETVKRIDGVESVDNQLEVLW